jgi:hypothetical protein
MLSDIINAVQSIVQGVAKVGQVHAYRRAVATESDFLALYKDEATGMVRAWDITRENTASIDYTVGETQETHLIVLRGYMSVSDKDATEQTFQNLVEDVRTALRAKRNLNGKVLTTTPAQARTVAAATIGSVLCHYAELSFTATEFPVPTT